MKAEAHHYFADPDRWEQLKEYPPDAKDCQFAKPEDILDEEHKNVLVVGRPGIGKTSLSTKVLRLWASGEAFNAVFNVVFLVKFRLFNGSAKLSLRELLARAATAQRLDDSVWEFVQNQTTKVLLIFDGLDEYLRKEEINTHEDYNNDVGEKMPVSVLYKKLAVGQLLRGASILTTTRPTAVKHVANVDFQRTVEIRGFTSENVEEYVNKFTKRYPGEKGENIGAHQVQHQSLFIVLHPSELLSRLPLLTSKYPMQVLFSTANEDDGHLSNDRKNDLVQSHARQGRILSRGTRNAQVNAHV